MCRPSRLPCLNADVYVVGSGAAVSPEIAVIQLWVIDMVSPPVRNDPFELQAAGDSHLAFGAIPPEHWFRVEQQPYFEVSLALVGVLRPAMPDLGDSVYDARAPTTNFETSDLLCEPH